MPAGDPPDPIGAVRTAGAVRTRASHDVELRRYGLDDFRDLLPAITDIYRDAYADRSYDPFFAVHRFSERAWRNALPGWEAVIAWSEETPVGYMAGVPLPAGTRYWSGVGKDPASAALLAEGFFEEDGARTVATIDLMVRPGWRRAGIGYLVHEAVLDARQERRAAGSVEHGNRRLAARYARWGYRTVATKRPLHPDGPELDMLVRELRVDRGAPIGTG